MDIWVSCGACLLSGKTIPILMTKKKSIKKSGQTQKGRYSQRLSDQSNLGKHRSFREDLPFFRQVLESLDDYAIFTTDLKNNISSWNTGAERLLGYSESEIIGKPCRILFTPEDNRKHMPEKEIAGARKHGSQLDERFHVRKDGSRFFVSGKMFTLKDENGKLRGYTKIMRDITHLQVVMQMVKEAKDYAESIVNTAREPMVVLNNDLTVNTANQPFYKTFKCTRKATENKSIYDLGNGQWNIPALKVLLEDILPHNSSFSDFEVTHEFEGIGPRIMLLNARKLRPVGNPAEMILLAFEDITEKKQMEQFKNAFIGVAGHELRAPVTSIKGYAQLLQRHAQEEADGMAISSLKKIDGQANKLTELINHLLDISRIQSGKLQLDRTRFDMNVLAAGVIADVMTHTRTHRIVCRGKVDQDVYGDKFRIGQVLTNLLTNAIKYSPEANKIVVKFGHDRNKTHARITVQDFGIGISEEEQADLFKAFYRAKSGKNRNIPGIGLGLHIAAEIVRAHGGKLLVDSKPGKGSSFHFTIPFES